VSTANKGSHNDKDNRKNVWENDKPKWLVQHRTKTSFNVLTGGGTMQRHSHADFKSAPVHRVNDGI
jgi:hypothetical protein